MVVVAEGERRWEGGGLVKLFVFASLFFFSAGECFVLMKC